MSAAVQQRNEMFPPASAAPAENWDDDFLFQAEDSPAKPPPSRSLNAGHTHHPMHRQSTHSLVESLGWDEELEREEAERQSSVGSSSLGPAAGALVAPRPDLSRWAEEDEDLDQDFGVLSRRSSEAAYRTYSTEDTVSPLPVFSHNHPCANTLPSPSKRTRTNTSPSRSSSTSASAQSSPVMHTRQVPSSPALSLFSTSTSTAQQYTASLAGSTAHLHTTRSHDPASPVGPFIPAQPRPPRRRLRKKSRPAQPGDIAEDDAPAYVMREPSPEGLGLDMAEEEGNWSEDSNRRERTPSPVHSPVAGPSSPPTRTPLLSRIGSLKTKLGRRPKYSTSPATSSTAPPTTPARSRVSRSSTTPKAPPQTPRARAPSWFRPSQNGGGSSPEEPIPSHPHEVTRRRSKEPFWKTVGSFSSGKSPVGAPHDLSDSNQSEKGERSDHESTVKKPPRKSLASGSRPPLPDSSVFPLPSASSPEHLPQLPTQPGSPTPPGGKLMKARRPMSMGGANARPPVVNTGRTAASLGRGAGMGWVNVLNGRASSPAGEAEEREKENSILRSLRKFSGHGRKRSGGLGDESGIGLGMPRVASSSAGTMSSRIPSTSTSTNASSRRPSLSMGAGVSRTASMSAAPGSNARAPAMLKSASAIVLSSVGQGREYNPSGSVFTLPLAMGEDEDDQEDEGTTDQKPVDRPSLTVDPAPGVESPIELRSSSSFAGGAERPSASLDLRPLTPHSRPASPLLPRSITPHATGSPAVRPVTPHSRPPTPQAIRIPSLQSTPHGARVMTPYAARPSSPLAMRRPSTPLAGPPTTFDNTTDDECSPELESGPTLDTVHEGEISRYEALDDAAKLDWLEAVAALPTPDPDFDSSSRSHKHSSSLSSPLATIVIEEGTGDSIDSGTRSGYSGRPSLTLSSAGRSSTSTESGYRYSSSLGPSSRNKLHRKSSSLVHTKSASEPNRPSADLLPPIELQPPSPPQTLAYRSGTAHQSLLALTSPTKTPPRSHPRVGGANSPPMGHSSSLSRAATQPGGQIDGSVLRRNSLSDLKIPARISRAQSGLKSNLGMVREFAASIEQIRGLQIMYRNLLADLKYAIENNEPLSPVLFPPANRSSATSATLVRVPSRDIGRVTERLNGIDERYSLWWECADVLVELGGAGSTGRDGGGSGDKAAGGGSGASSASDAAKDGGKGRERAITLAGDQAAPSVEPAAKKDQWYKDRGELSPRQLQILREMLTTPNPSLLHVPTMASTNASTGYLNALHPGGTASAITLPSSSASSHAQGPPVAVKAKTTGGGKIRRASRAGITGIRDLLRHLNLKKAANSDREGGSRPATRLGGESKVNLSGGDSRVNLAAASQVNLGVASSQSQVNLPAGIQSQLNLASHAQLNRPYPSRSHGPSTAIVPLPSKSSPRRPSLASIFRLNGSARSKSKNRAVSSPTLSKEVTPNTSAAEDDESDWDRMDSASDLDMRVRDHPRSSSALGNDKQDADEKDATLRGRKSGSASRVSNAGRPPVPALPAKFAANQSQVSLPPKAPEDPMPESNADGPVKMGSNRLKQRPPISLAGTGTSAVQPGLRSAPLQPGNGYPGMPEQPSGPGGATGGPGQVVEGRLALTPENIKPLLEYAREVAARLGACVTELRELGLGDGDRLSA